MAGRLPEAVEASREAFSRAQEIFGAGGRNALLVETEDVYGRALADSGQLAAGIEHLQKSIERTEALLGPNNGSIASKLSWLARAQMKLGDLPGAISSMTRSVGAATNDLDRARAQAGLGVALVAARRIDTAIDTLRTAVEDLQRLDTGEGSWLPNATATYGIALALAGQTTEAQRVLQASLKSGKVAGPVLADTHNGLGFSALENSRNAAAALDHFQKALATNRRSARPALANPRRGGARRRHGATRTRQSQGSGAVAAGSGRCLSEDPSATDTSTRGRSGCPRTRRDARRAHRRCVSAVHGGRRVLAPL